MAKPRIFVSSTYYDLKVVCHDLERFIRDQGFDPVMFERGHVAYGSQKPPEDYCYKEIESCDILVCIIGGKFGTESKEGIHSITQKELRTAIELSKQIYIFAEKAVLAEFQTYQRNKGGNVNWAAVDDIRVYKFIDEIYALPIGNPVFPFENSADIMTVLQEQWSGLFQRLLVESARQKEVRLVSDLNTSVATLNQLVTFLTEDKKNSDLAVRQILQATHPIFGELKRVLSVQYRVFFTNLKELSQWLSARSFVEQDTPPGVEHEWRNEKEKRRLVVSSDVFDENNRLKILTPDEWKKDYVKLEKIPDPVPPSDDDVPF
jgi:hypothetical protein